MAGNFYDLPPWDDERLKSMQQAEDDEDGEGWRPNPTGDACKSLYEQWRHVFFLLNIILADLDDSPQSGSQLNEINAEQADMLIGDAHIVAVKIRSSEATGMFVTRMENASIIRTHAQSIASGLLMLCGDNIDDNHVDVIREEIDKFRELFKVWVASFERDEFEDQWGLFI